MVHGRLFDVFGFLRRPARMAMVLVATVAVLNVAQAAPSSAATSPTVVSITFDNGWSSQMTAAAALQAHGMAGTFYIISGWLGLPGFVSLSDVQSLAAAGNEIGGKTVNNSDLPTLPADEAKREICEGRNNLLADGFSVTDFAYPFADLSPTAISLVQECGFNSGRNVGDLNSLDTGGCRFPDCPYAESIPPADPYNMRTPDDGESTTTLANMEGDVTEAANNGGGWLNFSFHQICDTSTPGCDPTYSVSPALFNQFLDWLQTQVPNGVSVKTVQQVIGGDVQPAVLAPTVPPAAPGTNALVNPTLNTASPLSPANPQCWTPESYGTNTPSFAWSPTGGPNGDGQETITMSNLTSGDAKLVTTFDLGQCAPTAVVGDSYALSAQYKASGTMFFTVYGRSTTGTWAYWTQSPVFAAANDWTAATWTTPPVPANIEALSFGATIDHNGTLSSSDYSLVDTNTASVPPPPQPQAISFTAPGSGTVGGQTTVSATGGASANPVVFSLDGSSDAGACSLSGTNNATVGYTAAGHCVIDADQAGNAGFTAAPQVQQTITIADVPKSNQTITFGTLSNKTMTQSPVTVGGSASSGLPVAFTSTTPTVCTASGTNGTTITLLKAGACGVRAEQGGNATFNPAPSVGRSFTVSRVAQTITFNALPARTLAQSPVKVAATATSKLAVTFTTTTPAVCRASETFGTSISLLRTGTCVVRSTQAGNTAYNAATPVSRQFTVSAVVRSRAYTTLADLLLQSPWLRFESAQNRATIVLIDRVMCVLLRSTCPRW
jgi:peptidoglycan/xylan/chitin deacetylase (PgdA/CDA1 family)